MFFVPGDQGKSGRKIILSAACICLLAAVFFLGLGIGRNVHGDGKNKGIANESAGTLSLMIGDHAIDEYVIVAGAGGSSAAKRLSGYIETVTGTEPDRAVGGDHERYIRLERDQGKDDNSVGISISDGNVTITGKNAGDLQKQTDIFANRYLGIAFAGEAREHVIYNGAGVVNVPAEAGSVAEPWIGEREPIICLWNTSAPRGVFYNSGTARSSEILSYSDDELYNYVRMMASFGYTGIQVTDMCSAWAYYGGYGFVHDRIGFMADAAHSLGMNFTLWVWGAEFGGYGWTEKDIDYYGKCDANGNWDYANAYDNPEALKVFEKYYDIYAQLAGKCDRVIGHYNDPGNLRTNGEIAYFASMLRDRFRAVNPDVIFGVNCYTGEIDPGNLYADMGGDVEVYIGARTSADKDWGTYRDICRINGIDFGIWSWYLTEMEIDQLAEMNVNADLIKNVYTRTREEDAIAKPVYWSEMDSYHVLNLFSHFVAGKLLEDPERDQRQLLYEAAEGVVGSGYAESLYDILSLIEDARTGPVWETYRWECDEYRIKSPDYDYESYIEKSEKGLADLEEMIGAELSCNTIPLPVSVSELLSLIRPHVEQIREYSIFRRELDKAAGTAENGAAQESLQAMINELYRPVPEFNVITGVWGIPEARAQYELTEEFCEKYGLEVPQDPVFIYFRKQRIYDEFVTQQRRSSTRVTFAMDGFQWGYAYGKEETERLTRQLVDEGLLTEEDGRVYVTDWERYRYDF